LPKQLGIRRVLAGVRTFRMTKQKKATTFSKKIRRAGKLAAPLPADYARLLTHLKDRVRAAQLRAAVSVNRELIALYWEIGKAIVDAQESKGYGKQVVERLAADLRNEFPGMAGFSPQNVWFMRGFLSCLVGDPAKTLTSCERI
jgi:hypothetical protein